MNPLPTGPIAQSIGWALLHLSWQATLVAAILATVLALLRERSANARYLASCAALAMLPVLAVATAWRCYEPLAALPPTSGAMHATTMPIDIARAAVVHATRSTIESAGDLARSALPWVVLIWLAGVTILSTRLFVSWSRVQRLAASAFQPALQWYETLAHISDALDLRVAVRILESAAIEVPTVVGWLRPAILLPASTLSGLSLEQIEMLLAHELAHVRRNDFLVNVLQSVIETLFFYHPAVWWVSNRIRIEREHCCDDLAVAVNGSAVQYARALTRLEELRSVQRNLVLAANGGSLIGRIRRLVGAPADVSSAVPRWVAGAGVLAILIAILSAPTLPLRADKEKPSPKVPAPAKASTTTPATSHVEVVEQHVSADDDTEVSESETDSADTVDSDDAPEVPVTVGDVHTTVRVSPLIAPRAPVIDVQPLIASALAGVRPMVAIAPQVAAAAAEAEADASAQAPHAMRLRHREFGASGKLTVDELIELRDSGVTPEYIEQMRSAGMGDLSLGDIVAMRQQGVDPNYIRSMRAAGVPMNDAGDVIALRMQGVSPEYVKQMGDAGYKNLSARDLVQLRSMGVSPDYVKQMGDAGYRNLSSRDLMQLRSMGVTPAFVKSLADAGYTNLSTHDLIRLASQGISPEFIREISKYRDKQKK